MSRLVCHFFSKPVPYSSALRLQENLHQLQLARRNGNVEYPNLLLLLEHRPVYTTGRRQIGLDLAAEQTRLESLGADWVPTNRGGETTYHGPGQIVAYPLLDLARMSVRRMTVVSFNMHA